MDNELNLSANVSEKIIKIEDAIAAVIKECKSVKGQSSDPLVDALLETTTKVLEGLSGAYNAYHVSNETVINHSSRIQRDN